MIEEHAAYTLAQTTALTLYQAMAFVEHCRWLKVDPVAVRQISATTMVDPYECAAALAKGQGTLN